MDISQLIDLSELYSVNVQFVMLYFIVIMSSVFIILSICYYYYIERTKLIYYLISFFSVATLNQFAYAMYGIRLDQEVVDFWERVILLTDFLTLTIVFYFVVHITKIMGVKFRGFATILCVLGIYISGYEDFGKIFLIICSTFTLGILFIICLYAYHKRIIKTLYLLLVVNVFNVYFVLDQILTYVYNTKFTLDWLALFILISILTVYFLYRYKGVVIEKSKLYEQLIRDQLTGLFSKTYFYEVIKNESNGFVLFIDINKFKTVNDGFGHLCGDKVLAGFGEILANRGINHSKGLPEFKKTIASRVGGDEFMVYLPYHDQLQVIDYSNILFDSFRQLTKELGLSSLEGLGISIGVTRISDEDGHLINDIYDEADEAMYAAKKKGNYQLIFRTAVNSYV